MSDPLRPLRVNALELLRQPGTERKVEATIDAQELGVEHPRRSGDIDVEYVLESLHDGIVVSGIAAVEWSGTCRRCLRPIEGREVVTVDEIHQTEVLDDDAFPIENNQLDLAPMTRESILLALDDERLCRPECAGICPVCGVDRNEASCECDLTVRDERWAVLDELRLED